MAFTQEKTIYFTPDVFDQRTDNHQGRQSSDLKKAAPLRVQVEQNDKVQTVITTNEEITKCTTVQKKRLLERQKSLLGKWSVIKEVNVIELQARKSVRGYMKQKKKKNWFQLNKKKEGMEELVRTKVVVLN